MDKESEIKFFLKKFLLAGILYASVMAVIGYSDGDPFNIWRFVLNALFFGGFIGIIDVFKRRNSKK